MSKFVQTVIAVAAIVVGTYFGETWLVRIGVAILINEAASSLIGSPSAPSAANRPGDRIVQNNTIADATLIYGSMDHVGGPPSYWNVSGTNNEFIWYVIPISMRPIDSYNLLHLDMDTINLATDLDGSGNVNTGKYNGYVHISTYIGAIPATADGTLVATFGTEYTTAFRGSACAYFWVRLKRDLRTDDQISAAVAPQNVRLFQSGPPGEISVGVNGHHIYDPRQDSTNGGAGTQRMGDPTSWAFSSNAALVLHDYLTATAAYKSHYSNTGLNVGCLDWPNSIIDYVALATSAGICDVTFTTSESYSIAQFTINGLIDVGQTYGDNTQLMLTAMGGSLTPAGSKYQINAAQYIAPSFTMDETWIADSITIRSTQPVSVGDNYNSVRGTFIDDSQAYQSGDFWPFTNAAYIANDGGYMWKDIDLTLCTDRYGAQRVAILYGKMSRNQMIIDCIFNMKAMNVAIGDTATLTITNANIIAKVFKVYDWKLSSEGIELQMREESATPYSITTGELTSVPVSLTPGQIYPIAPPPTLVDVQGVADGLDILVVPPPQVLYKFMVVYRGTTSSRAAATYRGRFEGAVFHDHELNGGTFWYWIYSVNDANQLSTALAFGPLQARYGVDFTTNGVNLMPKGFSLFGINAIVAPVGTFGLSTITLSTASTYGYNRLRIGWGTNAAPIIRLRHAGISEINISLNNRRYICSLYLNDNNAGNVFYQGLQIIFKDVNDVTVVATGFLVPVSGVNTTPGVYYGILDMTLATTLDGYMALAWTGPVGVSGNSSTLQGVQVELQNGNNMFPSPYTVPTHAQESMGGQISLITGSTPSMIPNMTFSYTATTSSITWSWGSFSLLRPDGSSTTVASGSQPVTGLSHPTTFWAYPYYDEVIQAVEWAGGGTGSPLIFRGSANATSANAQVQLGRCPLSSSGMQASTPSSGTGGGAGGGLGCLWDEQLVYCLRNSVAQNVRADEIRLTDKLWTPDGWAEIYTINTEDEIEWWGITFDNGMEIVGTNTEVFYHPDMSFTYARDLRPDNIILSERIFLAVTQVRKFRKSCKKIQLGIAGSHLFYVLKDGPLIHNTTYKP